MQPPAIFITITMFGPGLRMCVRTAPDLARQTALHSFQPPLCELRSLHSSTASPICPSELCPTEFYTSPKKNQPKCSPAQQTTNGMGNVKQFIRRGKKDNSNFRLILSCCGLVQRLVACLHPVVSTKADCATNISPTTFIQVA